VQCGEREMRLHFRNTNSTRRRHRSGAPPANIEIQKELGKALRKHYDFPTPELPHQLLTLMIQLNAKDDDKE
jgi:hypothetical protein